jgi:ATP-binding cassette subfamily B (MDR/TAP) protein 1
MHTVVLKDKKNKEAHEESARLACEAAAAVKTVASLTREQGFVDAYSRSLGGPLQVATRSAVTRMFWFGCTQSVVFLVNALVSAYLMF